MNATPPAATPQRALVVGLGSSGQAVCELLRRRGVEVVATDISPPAALAAVAEGLERRGCLVHLGAHREEDFLSVDEIIVSPGVPLDLAPLRAAAARGVEIVGELEWAWRQTNLPVLAVTGTNGKTTTTTILGDMCRETGRHVFVGGNIGTPLSRWLLTGEPAELLVLEVSSFQLDTATSFRPHVGVLLNISEDHLDRYADFDAYVRSKISLFDRQQPGDYAVVNGDDPRCRPGPGHRGTMLTFSRTQRDAHACLHGQTVVVRLPEADPVQVDVARSPLRGPHNEENLLAAVLAGAALGISAAAMQAVVERARGLPHRLEWVRRWHGVDFYDDSKGTNVGAVVRALENFDRPVVLLVGGRDKRGSYEPLVAAVRPRVKALFVYGEAGPRLYEAFRGTVPTQRLADLAGAFQAAVAEMRPGDVVLLSPACSSFDQYESYAQRGEHFKRLVGALTGP